MINQFIFPQNEEGNGVQFGEVLGGIVP